MAGSTPTAAEGGRADIVCNNAGVGTRGPSFEETDDALWERTLAIDLRGVILGCKYAIPALRRRGGGAIVNTASMAGVVGIPSDPIYAASKAGVVMLTRSLRGLLPEAGKGGRGHLLPRLSGGRRPRRPGRAAGRARRHGPDSRPPHRAAHGARPPRPARAFTSGLLFRDALSE